MQRPALSQSQWQNEMSGTCPRPCCAPAARHGCVSPWSERSWSGVWPPLLLLGEAPAAWSLVRGSVHWGVGCFQSCCACDVCCRRDTRRCPHRCLVWPSWSHMQDRDAPKADPELPLEGHFGDTSAKQTCALARGGGGKQGHPLQLILHPSSLPQHSQTLPPPQGLLQEILLFTGMFVSKIPRMGLRKKIKIKKIEKLGKK